MLGLVENAITGLVNEIEQHNRLTKAGGKINRYHARIQPGHPEADIQLNIECSGRAESGNADKAEIEYAELQGKVDRRVTNSNGLHQEHGEIQVGHMETNRRPI